MKVALVSAELEENLGLRYIASSLEHCGHKVTIIGVNSEHYADSTVQQTLAFEPEIVALTMVFTSRSGEFCRLARHVRETGFSGHLIAGGPLHLTARAWSQNSTSSVMILGNALSPSKCHNLSRT